MRKTIVSGLAAMLGLASASAFAQGNYGGNNGNIVRCESNDSRTRECPANTRAGVQLVRQLSKERCMEGRNWGYHRRGIWVSGGCRADFEVGGRWADGGWNDNRPGNGEGWGGGWNGNRIVRCDSNDRRTQECPADTRGGVRLVRKFSDTRCVEGQTWGYHRDRIWVSGGCRAEFEVGRGSGSDWNNNRIVRCDSNDRRTQECPADTRGGVRLVRKLSETRCVEGQTWGYRRDRIWVSGGCRAEFEVGGRW